MISSKKGETWIDNYQTDNGQEFGAKIAGSRIIAGSQIFDSQLKVTTELIMKKEGNEPDERGRGAIVKKNNQARRPVELVALGI